MLRRNRRHYTTDTGKASTNCCGRATCVVQPRSWSASTNSSSDTNSSSATQRTDICLRRRYTRRSVGWDVHWRTTCCYDAVLLLLAAPTWLWVRCGRHNSPPASSVIYFICRRSDGCHVSVDTVHPYLLRSSLFSHPRWYRLQILFTCVKARESTRQWNLAGNTKLCMGAY